MGIKKGETDMQFKIYTDGSYRDGMWGAGAILIAPNGEVKKYSSFGKDECGSRNVTGEINAVVNALRALFKLVDRNERHEVVIYRDYEGIQKWAENQWKANKPIAVSYKETIEKARAYFDLSFVKVKAHTGDKFNELADQLANEALHKGFAQLAQNASQNVPEATTQTVTLSLEIDSVTLAEQFGSMENLLNIIAKQTSCKVTRLK